MSTSVTFSLIVPVLDEETMLPETYQRLCATLDGLNITYEVLVVDNGSTDRTPEIMADICRRDQRWCYIRLSRNFSYQNSITAGMLAAHGEAIMVIDADLQDPPELIAEFLARWREGYDIVYGVRQRRTGESIVRVAPTMLALRFITWMSDEPKLPLNSSDFRLISRRVRDAFAQLGEANRYVRGMIHWLGFRQIGIPYERRGRTKGVTKANLLFLIGFTFNAVFSFSTKPLWMFSLFGAAVLGLTSLLGLTYLTMYFFADPPQGIMTIVLLQLATLGIVSLGIGVLGEYTARVYVEVKNRPLWLVDYTLNYHSDSHRVPESPKAHSVSNPAA